MLRIKFVLLVVASMALAGCASVYTRDTVTEPQTKLNPGSSVIIATPQDGSYGSQSYAGSGAQTAEAVQAAFARHSNSVHVSRSCNKFECLESSSTTYGYYVVPQILHWEERATEWSGKRDRIEVKITVYSPSAAVDASTIISGKSKWATFGGDHPQDLLQAPINKYVGTLY